MYGVYLNGKHKGDFKTPQEAETKARKLLQTDTIPDHSAVTIVSHGEILWVFAETAEGIERFDP